MQFEGSEPPPLPTVAPKYLIHERPVLRPFVHIQEHYNKSYIFVYYWWYCLNQKRSDVRTTFYSYSQNLSLEVVELDMRRFYHGEALGSIFFYVDNNNY